VPEIISDRGSNWYRKHGEFVLADGLAWPALLPVLAASPLPVDPQSSGQLLAGSYGRLKVAQTNYASPACRQPLLAWLRAVKPRSDSDQ
jgi:hypothetical protein